MVQSIFLHHTYIYSFIKAYLYENTVYRQDYGLWYSNDKKLFFNCEMDDIIAILIYNADYELNSN